MGASDLDHTDTGPIARQLNPGCQQALGGGELELLPPQWAGPKRWPVASQVGRQEAVALLIQEHRSVLRLRLSGPLALRPAVDSATWLPGADLLFGVKQASSRAIEEARPWSASIVDVFATSMSALVPTTTPTRPSLASRSTRSRW